MWQWANADDGDAPAMAQDKWRRCDRQRRDHRHRAKARAKHARCRHQHLGRRAGGDRPEADRGRDRSGCLYAQRIDQGNGARPSPCHHHPRCRSRRFQRNQQPKRRCLCRRSLPEFARIDEFRLLRSRTHGSAQRAAGHALRAQLHRGRAQYRQRQDRHFAATTGRIGGSIGNYGSRDVEGMVNVPLSPEFALRFAGKGVFQNAGYYFNRRDQPRHRPTRRVARPGAGAVATECRPRHPAEGRRDSAAVRNWVRARFLV